MHLCSNEFIFWVYFLQLGLLMKNVYQLGKVLALTGFLLSAIACGEDHSHGEDAVDEEKEKHGHSHSSS